MPLQTRNQKAKEDMEGKTDKTPDESLTMEQKISRIFDNMNKMSEIQTDLTLLTSTVNTQSSDLTALKQNTDTIPKIETTLNGIQDSIKTLKVDNAANKIQLKENQARIQTLEQENTTLRTEIENLKCQARKQTNLQQENIDELIDCHIRRDRDKCSLMFECINETTQLDIKTIIKQISFDAGVQLQEQDITEAYRIGKRQNKGGKPRLIKATFTSKDTRNAIYANRENIKKNEACHHVWINECLDAEQRKARAETRAIVDLAKTLGKEAKAVADVAIISGIKYSHKSFPTLPPQITLEKAFTRQLNGKLYFNSEHSPFSSFYPTPINYGNEKYANNEQAFQHQRAVNAGSLDVAAEIKQTTDPRRCRFLSRMIPASPNWDNKKDEVMGDLVQIKVQDPSIKLKLQQTGDLDLVECTSDSYWACGASFRSKKVQTNTTTGANKLGKIWMDTRRNIKLTNKDASGMPALEDTN